MKVCILTIRIDDFRPLSEEVEPKYELHIKEYEAVERKTYFEYDGDQRLMKKNLNVIQSTTGGPKMFRYSIAVLKEDVEGAIERLKHHLQAELEEIHTRVTKMITRSQKEPVVQLRVYDE